MGEIVDLFAGPGGWSEALRLLGRSADEIGIEYEPNACKTRTAAGHRTRQADVSTIDERQYLGLEGLIASPPCQAFSSAGKGAARDVIPELLDSIHNRRWTDRADPDPRVWLIVDLGRWIEHLTPEWIALEQVPAVLPIWRTYAEMLRERGYSVWTGVLNSADYGVPQTRQRAILIASRSKLAHPPETSHAESPVDSLFGMLEPWVPVIAVLPHLAGRMGFPRLDDRGDSPDGYRERDWRPTTEPAFALTEKARSWIINTGQRSDVAEKKVNYTRDTDRPSPTIISQSKSWILTRPATTVIGDPGAQSENAVRLTICDALILQSFRPDYPVQGSKTKQFEQIGNAIPPLLARRVLEAVLPSRVRQDHT